MIYGKLVLVGKEKEAIWIFFVESISLFTRPSLARNKYRYDLSVEKIKTFWIDKNYFWRMSSL